jgi:hypothetical protein
MHRELELGFCTNPMHKWNLTTRSNVTKRNRGSGEALLRNNLAAPRWPSTATEVAEIFRSIANETEFD